MKELIRKIIENEDIDKIFDFIIDRIFKNGPVSVSSMEILAYLALYRPEEFEYRKDDLINILGVFFKKPKVTSLIGEIFHQYGSHIKEQFSESYTPIQASISKGIDSNKCFSFSAPTSTGKSFVFMKKILGSSSDVVVVVPSRALINEYYLKITDLISDKSVNILTFIDKINIKHAKRNIFIVTPERCRDLFKQKDNFSIELFLFDEAQLGNEDSKRGLYFDSIIRRCYKAYPNSTFVFAHPFVKNPEAQIKKNNFSEFGSHSFQYEQKNIGQLFLCADDNFNFFHFGIEKSIMGSRKYRCEFDPIEKTIKSKGSVLFYVAKSKIYDLRFLKEFEKYINLCDEIKDPKINSYIDQLKQYTGGETEINKSHFSRMLSLLKRGIVIHHGSLPLQTRLIIEQFTKGGNCRICFATSTLEQGINMPFDVVFLDRLEASKPLAVKNLIGRAGRSTEENKFDYGYVIIKSTNTMSKFRNIMNLDEQLDNISLLEKDDLHDEDYNDFKDAILNGTYSDEFNLTQKELGKLSTIETDRIIKKILDAMYRNGILIGLDEINRDLANKLALYSHFQNLYSMYLGRDLEEGEIAVLNTAIKIIFWRIYGKTFKNICWYRYSYASRSHEREVLERQGLSVAQLEAAFFTAYKDIPDKQLKVYSALNNVKAKDVDYDFIMYDTYDYIDKLIGFKLSDVFYATFSIFYDKTGDERSDFLSKYIKYGTKDKNQIWMLRYGLTFEDIEFFGHHIESIDSQGIIFKGSISSLTEDEKKPISRYIF